MLVNLIFTSSRDTYFKKYLRFEKQNGKPVSTIGSVIESNRCVKLLLLLWLGYHVVASVMFHLMPVPGLKLLA
jgi:hypothetical protein